MSRAQIRTPSHQLVETSLVPSGLKFTPSTVHPEPRRTSCCAPVYASNSRTVPSVCATATRDPSGLKAMLPPPHSEVTLPKGPWRSLWPRAIRRG